MLSKEQIEAVAQVVRDGRQVASNVLADLLDGCVETIEHYREQAARWVAAEDRSGYHPYVVANDDQEILIQIFTADDGSIDLVQLAYREEPWSTWSPPVTARKG